MNTTYLIYDKSGSLITKYCNANAIQNSVAIFGLKIAIVSETSFSRCVVRFRRPDNTLLEIECEATTFEFENHTYTIAFSCEVNSALNISGLAHISIACFDSDNNIVFTSVETTYRIEKSNYFKIDSATSNVLVLGETDMSATQVADTYATSDYQYIYFTANKIASSGKSNYLLSQHAIDTNTLQQVLIDLDNYSTNSRTYDLSTGTATAFLYKTYSTTAEIDTAIATSMNKRMPYFVIDNENITILELYNLIHNASIDNRAFIVLNETIRIALGLYDSFCLCSINNTGGSIYSIILTNYRGLRSCNIATSGSTILKNATHTLHYFTYEKTASSNYEIVNKKLLDDSFNAIKSTTDYFKKFDSTELDLATSTFSEISSAVELYGSYVIFHSTYNKSFLCYCITKNSSVVQFIIFMNYPLFYLFDIYSNNTTLMTEVFAKVRQATDYLLGGFKTGYTNADTQYKAVQLDSDGKAYVYVASGGVVVATSSVLGGIYALATGSDEAGHTHNNQVRIDNSGFLHTRDLYEHLLEFNYNRGAIHNYFNIKFVNDMNKDYFDGSQFYSPTLDELGAFVEEVGHKYQYLGSSYIYTLQVVGYINNRPIASIIAEPVGSSYNITFQYADDNSAVYTFDEANDDLQVIEFKKNVYDY